MQKVALLSTRGLPAEYGAFEQTISELVGENRYSDNPVHYFVGTDKKLKEKEFNAENCDLVYAKRLNGVGVIFYGIITTFLCWARGCTTFVYFGYAMAPIFPILQVCGYKVICNVDGFEWRRAKWGRLAKLYFRFCESICGKSRAHLVSDANTIKRYFQIKHSTHSTLIRYGAEVPSITTRQKHNYFVVVMRMEPENNIKLIVEGFSKSISTKKLHLIGPSTPYFEKNILQLINQDERIVYRGPIYDRDKLINERAGAFAYIHGHSVGGTNPTLVEACYMGAPIICFDTRFNREVLCNNATFFKHEKELTKIINQDQSLSPPPELAEEYTWSYVAKEYRRLIDG